MRYAKAQISKSIDNELTFPADKTRIRKRGIEAKTSTHPMKKNPKPNEVLDNDDESSDDSVIDLTED
jgi:hypothetical protein